MATNGLSNVLTQQQKSYGQRATSAPHPLSSYLLRLMSIKKSNLCLSADVTTAQALLQLADAIGPSIVILKTHYDLVSNWDYNATTGTGARLANLATKHGFLIFEDRKFGDIGNTVQMQYTEGTARIIEWSHITNVNMVPGAAAVDAMAEAAAKWRERKRYEVKTDITVGTPRPESVDSEGEGDFEAEIKINGTGLNHYIVDRPAESSPNNNIDIDYDMPLSPRRLHAGGRKSSIVSITTVSQIYEPANSPRSIMSEGINEEPFPLIEEPPLHRGLLILAQMSSAGNFMNAEYTAACVQAARRHTGYVMGFISMETLNSEPDDAFLCMTPGCQLPPEDADENAPVKGDGKGQQYNTPAKIVGILGNDVIIVGRGIIKALDPVAEAKRYQKKGWEAYMSRLAPESVALA